MKTLRLTDLAAAALILALTAAPSLSMAGPLNTQYDAMVKTYAAPPSTFVDVDGVRVHVRDEGEGPTVLMLHSSMSNLHIWDAWADELKKDHRVVRLDWPPYGLTVDNSGQTGMLHAATVVAGVVDKLKLDDFVIIGSSSGATLSVLYTAAHPEKVRAMALSTLPLNAPPTTKAPMSVSAWNWAHEKFMPGYYPRTYWRAFLKYLYGNPALVTDAQVRMFADTNNLQGGYARVRSYYQSNVKGVWTSGAGSYASKITVPILLQWGDRDPVLPPYLAKDAVANFSNTKVTLIHYPQGHYPMLEDPGPTVRDLKAFLAGLPAKAAIVP